eukprot:723037-Pyramimonas_sp.AAC.1
MISLDLFLHRYSAKVGACADGCNNEMLNYTLIGYRVMLYLWGVVRTLAVSGTGGLAIFD